MQTIKPVSENNQVIFEQISEEIEQLYLPQYLGRSFAYDVQTNPANYTDLLSGVVFDDCDGNPIKFLGVYYWLAYFTFAEYSWQTKYKDTMTGFVSKNREEATDLSQGMMSNIKNNARKIGEHQVEIMKEYLNENTATYTLWNCAKGKGYTPKFTPIKRTDT
jgi:hypothetical protein